jgi:PAS domain S-box-containing protein
MSELSNGGRERAYLALRESEELHRVTLAQISDAVFLTDDAGCFTYICPNVNVIFGYLPDEVQAFARIGFLLGENLFDPADLAAQGEIRNIERDVESKFGDPRHLLIHVKAVSIKGSTVLYTCRDITERARAQEALRMARFELAHASRLAVAGQLMASIAHEISQPLTSIISNADAALALLVADQDLKSGELREILADISAGGRLASNVVGRLRALVRKQPLTRRALDVNRLTDDTLYLIKGEVRRRHVALLTELAPSLPSIEADQISLQQVLLNLVMNALDAMDAVDEDKRRLVVRTLPADGSVEVVISDTGPGIPTGSLQKVFDPFFTTKREGLGLGLVIAKTIVEEHGGAIWAEHAPLGATFHVFLPYGSRVSI